jgi:hypothetical protein
MKKLTLILLVIPLFILVACTTAITSPTSVPATQSIELATITPTPLQALPPLEITPTIPQNEAQASPEPTLEPINPTEMPTTEPGAYPSSPETVVYAFLDVYQEDPNQMVAYLSQNLLGQIPDGDYFSLLGFNTPLEGFVFQAGTGDLQTAVIDVSLQTGGIVLQRIFHLVVQDGLWLIDQIEIPE